MCFQFPIALFDMELICVPVKKGGLSIVRHYNKTPERFLIQYTNNHGVQKTEKCTTLRSWQFVLLDLLRAILR